MENEERDPKLRKVEFTLEGADLFIDVDLTLMEYENDEERERITKKREGYFHCFGNRIQKNDDEYIPVIVGYIEDCEDGQVYEVRPRRIRFID